MLFSCVVPSPLSETERPEDSGLEGLPFPLVLYRAPEVKPLPEVRSLFQRMLCYISQRLLVLYPSRSHGSFSDLQHENLVKFLEVKPKRVWGSPKTAVSKEFVAHKLVTLSLQEFIQRTS